jgi:hypothetical protein
MTGKQLKLDLNSIFDTQFSHSELHPIYKKR